MTRRTSLVLSALVLAGGVTAFAQSVHLKGGSTAKPIFIDLGVVLETAGAISGLGNGDVLISLTAEADVTSTCTNQGGNTAPGQNPAPITVSGGQAIPEDELKNGNTPFHVLTVAPVTIIPGAPDCANNNWTEEITDLAFTSAVVTVEQPVGNLVLTVTCTFTPPTTNGLVPRASVACQ